MATKTNTNLYAPDGSEYVTLTDGNGNLIGGGGPSGGQEVEGTVASGATDSGNPVKVGGIFETTPATVTNGQRSNIHTSAQGVLLSTISSAAGTQQAVLNSANDAQSANLSLAVVTQSQLFNGATWDRVRTLGASSIQTTPTGLPVVVQIPQSSVNAGIVSSATATVNSAQVVKASAGNLYSFSCGSGASAGYLMIFDATAAPADGAVTPIWVEAVAINSTVNRIFTYPLRCNTGITLVFSTTGPLTKTASATAFLSGQAV